MADVASTEAEDAVPALAASRYSRRPRPPDLRDGVVSGERIPLRPTASAAGSASETASRSARGANAATPGRREPRLGLRSVRASIADFANWPSAFRSDNAPPPLAPSSMPTPAMPLSPSPPSPAQTTFPSSSSARRVAAAATPAPWDPPPLFKAYPQAVKHAQLSACTTPIEQLLRLQQANRNGSMAENIRAGRSGPDSSSGPFPDSPSSPVFDTAPTTASSLLSGVVPSSSASGFKKAKQTKKKHRPNGSLSSIRLEWTTKIYVLVTSGYLLQYAGDGSFDRLPEKMLHLGKDSAAFASDLIPGRHWVLQACASADAAAAAAAGSSAGTGSEPRSFSLLSRFAFRSSARRQASTMLMVFDNADDIESWITTLRHEIEHLGGKKSLSETGRPRDNDQAAQTGERSGNRRTSSPKEAPHSPVATRTVPVRDKDRFSRAFSSEDLASFGQGMPVSVGGSESRHGSNSGPPDIHVDKDGVDDDMSATNSIVSHDGRQLENLRDVATNRLSFISSGQRTMLTSDGSSPPCSPARDSFSSCQADDPPTLALPPQPRHSPPPPPPPAPMVLPPLDIPKQASSRACSRPRLNAAATGDRRPSMHSLTTSRSLSAADFRFLQQQQQSAAPQSSPSPILTAPPACPDMPGSAISQNPTNQHRALAAFPLPPRHPPASPMGVPNFSVPHLAAKQFSTMAKLAVHQTGQTAAYGSKDTSTEAPLGLSEESAEPSVVSLQSSFNKYGARRPLPAALTFSRTLSVVPDVPSPIRTPTASSIGSGENTRPSTSNGIQQNLRPARDASADTIRPRSSASDASTRHWAPFVARQQRLNSNASVPSTSLDMADPIPLLTRPIKPPPRRRSSFAAAQHEEPLSANPVEPLPQGTDSFDHAIRAREVHRKLLDAPRSQSALGTIRSLSPTTQLQQTRQTPAAYKRASMYTLGLSSSRSSMDVGHSRLDGHFLEDARGEPMAKLEPLGLRASASNVHLRSHSASSTKSHLNRRSMSHLADGPPPMPPPTCALPPLPPMGTGRRPRPM